VCSSFRRIRDKYEAEFRELEHSEKQTKERFNQMKSQMTEVEGRTMSARRIILSSYTSISRR
jgi:hypothetical protein